MGIYYLTILGVLITSLLAHLTGKSVIVDHTKKLHNQPFFVFLTGFLLTIVAGLRWRVGTDYVQYSINYSSYKEGLWNEIIKFNEPGINLISKLSSYIYDDYSMMFFLASAITIGLIVVTISKYSNMLSFSILLLILTGVWHGTFNGVRQYLAVAIVFAGHRYIIKKDLKKYILVIFLASLFHISAVSMILLYFIPLKKLNIKEIIILFLGSMVFLISYDFILPLVSSFFEIDTDLSYVQTDVNIMRIAVQFAPLLLYFFQNKNEKFIAEDNFYINIAFVNFFLWVATSGSAYLARLPIYTMIFLTLSYPRLVNFKDKKLKVTIISIILLFFFIFWYIEISKSYSLSHYKWIFMR